MYNALAVLMVYLQIIAPGGIPPLQYTWSHGDTSALVENLSAGLYTCIVTDATGCQSRLENIPIVSPAPLSGDDRRT